MCSRFVLSLCQPNYSPKFLLPICVVVYDYNSAADDGKDEQNFPDLPRSDNKTASEFRRYKKLIVKPCSCLAFSREICKSSSNITDVFIGSYGSRQFNSSINQSNTALYTVLVRNGQRCPGPRFHAGWKGIICIRHLHTHIFPGLEALFGERKEESSFATILLKCHGTTHKDIHIGSITHDA